jgi:hypothetical protein
MKIKQVDTPVKFEPVTFEVTIESIQELADLCGRLRGDCNHRNMPDGYSYGSTLSDIQGHVLSLCSKYGILK